MVSKIRIFCKFCDHPEHKEGKCQWCWISQFTEPYSRCRRRLDYGSDEANRRSSPYQEYLNNHDPDNLESD